VSFWVLTGLNPLASDCKGEYLLRLLRRCNLDAFWAREVSAVASNRRNLDQLVSLWETQVGLSPELPRLGPHPTSDVFRVSVAVGMLLCSVMPGRYRDYTQFETMHKFRSAYSNLYDASAQGAASLATLGRGTAKTFLTSCPTQSIWLKRFAWGCFRRMGQEARQDLALSVPIILELLSLLDREWVKLELHENK
jgi:hypothetical protein